MKAFISRRDFFRSNVIGAGVLALTGFPASNASTIEVFPRTTTPRLRLGLAAYSFRDSFLHGNKNKGPNDPYGKPLWDMFGFVDYCAEQGCDGAELTSYYFPPEVDEAYLIRLKRHAILRGVDISGTSVGNTFTLGAGEKRSEQIALVRRWIDYAAILGAPHIRIFAGEAPRDVSREEARKNCIQAIEEVAGHAAQRGVFLGVENHGGIVSDSDGLLSLVKAIQHPWVGVNLDTGNFHTPDPYLDLARCAPYAVNVQFKSEIRARDKAAEPADMGRMLGILREARYQGYVTLEYESKESPWTAVPRLLQDLRKSIAGR